MSVPSWWEAILLALAAYRCFRLICCDTILDRPREAIVQRHRHVEGLYRREIDVFLHCPWCLGFWSALAWWGAWEIWPEGSLVAAAPLAISTAVGMIQKLDP